MLDPEEAREALRTITAWPGYAPTPLLELGGLAQRTGVGRLFYKDEGGRFGLGSFKALGGAYAVYRYLKSEVERQTGERLVSPAPLLGGALREIVSAVTVTTATDGNHGRSVAWGAQRLGCRAVVYVHRKVSAARREAIEALGAEVVRVDGDYDAAVRRCAADAVAHGRTVVTDTSYDGCTELPLHVMQGYRVLVAEVLEQLPRDTRPTHAIVQGGVGALAAAVAEHLRGSLGSGRPRFVVVEPESADCLFQSALHGERRRASGDLDTIMGGLACGEPSMVAWEILREAADDFVTIPDASAITAVRLLSAGVDGDPPVIAGESAAAGVAALIEAADDAERAVSLGLSRRSIVLVIGTEGATDPAIWNRIVAGPVEGEA